MTAVPPLSHRLALALAPLAWPEAALAEVLAGVSAADAGGPWQASWREGRLWLTQASGACFEASAAGLSAGALQRGDAAALPEGVTLPSWLSDPPQVARLADGRWRAFVRAPEGCFEALADRCRPCEEVRAALSTCREGMGLELGPGGRQWLRVESPPPRVSAWVARLSPDPIRERVALALGARETTALSADAAGCAPTWLLA